MSPPVARHSYREATARQRLAGLLDPGSGEELLPPATRVTSPHLAALELPVAFDDGVVVCTGTLGGRRVLAAAQEGHFMGGAVGEVHGAKLVGLLERAERERPSAVILLLDSGGVRLQEANAGLVAVSEVMRAILSARAAGVCVLALVGGGWGCFGGMGIAARCCDVVIMSEEGRLGLSGPDVIETSRGVEEMDASDRALVWRTVGGKHRYLLGGALEHLDRRRPVDLDTLEREHRHLARRLADFGACRDGADVWRAAGVAEPGRLPLLDTAAFTAAVAAARRSDR